LRSSTPLRRFANWTPYKPAPASSTIKDYFVFVPFVLSAGAVTFDLGYFYGIDVKFFTLFSLSEHLLFALEALPSVFVIALAVMAIVFVVAAVRKIWQSTGRGVVGNLLAKIWADKRLLMFVGLISVSVATLFLPEWLGLLLIVLAGLVMYLVLLRSLSFALALLAITIQFPIFLLGFYSAVRFLENSHIEHQLQMQGELAQGKIIRSGDRGLLFFDVSNHQIRFIKWDNVIEVRRFQRTNN
jgi:hypothetical protein